MIKRLTVITGCVLALGVGVAACGDDDNDGGDGATTTEQPADTGMNQQQNIVAVAQATPDLSTLVEALSAADLVETLEEPGPYTVFAPTNEAFAALGNTLNTLLKPANKEELTEILTYHVVPGELTAAELNNGQMLETVQGDELEVKINGNNVTINGASVQTPDVKASNGIVHVIDEVLTPPNG